MLFSPWKPESSSVYIRFYVDGAREEYLHKTGNRIQIEAGSIRRRNEIDNILRSKGVFIENLGLRDLYEALSNSGLLTRSRSGGGRAQSYSRESQSKQNNVIGKGRFGFKESKGSDPFSFKNSNDMELYQEALYQDVSSAPFKSKTIDDAIVLVDHREPSDIYRKLLSTSLSNINLTSLPDGDYLITSRSNPNRILLIERKTITDLYNGITGDDKHAHEQVERYYRNSIAAAKDGIYMQVIWIVEGEISSDGKYRGLYNALSAVKNMDGWINYVSAICGQQTISTYNSNHTAYMIAKLVQGFVEESLYYPVKVRNMRVDLSASERRAMNKALLSVEREVSDKGVIKATDGLQGLLSIIPGINTKVAKELASSGLSFAQITNLSLDDLEKIKGIGKLTAQKIWNVFNEK